jgi:hypothetical protein
MTILSTLADAFIRDASDNEALGADEYVRQYVIDVESDGEALISSSADQMMLGYDFTVTRVIVTIAGTPDSEPRYTSVTASGPNVKDGWPRKTQQYKFNPSQNSLGQAPGWLRDVVFEHVPDRFLTRFAVPA